MYKISNIVKLKNFEYVCSKTSCAVTVGPHCYVVTVATNYKPDSLCVTSVGAHTTYTYNGSWYDNALQYLACNVVLMSLYHANKYKKIHSIN